MRSTLTLACLCVALPPLFASTDAAAAGLTYELITDPQLLTTNTRDFGPDGGTVGYGLVRLGFNGYTGSAETGFEKFSLPGMPSSFIYAYQQGALLGQSTDKNFSQQGFVQDADGVVTFLQDPDGGSTAPMGMSADGTIVGTFAPASGSPGQAGFILKDGVYTTFAVADSIDTEIDGISDDGVFVGAYRTLADLRYHGFVNRNGVMKTITVPGSYDTVVTGINNRHQIVGQYNQSAGGNNRGFVYDGKKFRFFAPQDSINTYAWHIDDSGRVVGFGIFADGKTRGFIGTPGK